MRRILARLLFFGAVFVGLIISAACVAGYLALQEPGFYTELCAEKFSPADSTAAKERFEQMRFEFLRWRDRAMDAQRAAWGAQSDTDTLHLGDSIENSHVVRIKETLINAMLASDQRGKGGDVQNPRVRITEDKFKFAFRIASPSVDCVLSVGLTPQVTTEDVLRLEVTTAHVGRLPIPIDALMRVLPREIVQTGRDWQLDLTSSKPRLAFTCFSDAGEESAKIESIECVDGELIVEFAPPHF